MTGSAQYALPSDVVDETDDSGGIANVFVNTLQVRVALGVGGLFDFLSERIQRAPQWLRQLGLEWAYRLKQEPARMWKRYVVGNPVFLLHILVQRYCGWVRPEPLGHFTEESIQSGPVKAIRALVLAHEGLCRPDGFSPLSVAFLPVADKPVLAHQLERLIAQGVRHIDVLCRAQDRSLVHTLIHSCDWGAQIRILPPLSEKSQAAVTLPDHLTRLTEQWLSNLNNLGSEAPAWVVQAHQLLHRSAFDQVETGEVLLFNGLPALALMDAKRQNQTSRVWTGLGFTLSQGHALVQATQHFRQLGLKPSAQYKEIAPQVWVHCDAKVRAKAVFDGPAFIGPFCVVESGCRIGPGTVLVEGVVLEGLSQIAASLILAPMHVRRTLSFDQTVVDASVIYKLDHDACLPLHLIQGHVVPTGGLHDEPRHPQEQTTAGVLRVA